MDFSKIALSLKEWQAMPSMLQDQLLKRPLCLRKTPLMLSFTGMGEGKLLED